MRPSGGNSGFNELRGLFVIKFIIIFKAVDTFEPTHLILGSKIFGGKGPCFPNLTKLGTDPDWNI